MWGGPQSVCICIGIQLFFVQGLSDNQVYAYQLILFYLMFALSSGRALPGMSICSSHSGRGSGAVNPSLFFLGFPGFLEHLLLAFEFDFACRGCAVDDTGWKRIDPGCGARNHRRNVSPVGPFVYQPIAVASQLPCFPFKPGLLPVICACCYVCASACSVRTLKNEGGNAYIRIHLFEQEQVTVCIAWSSPTIRRLC